MKIKQEHLSYMKVVIDKFIEVNGGKESLIEKYETGNFTRSETVKDLNTRFCFDMLYKSNLLIWVIDNIYPYANDAHIETALKSILPKLVKRY